MKERIFRIIQIGNREDIPSRAFDYFIVSLILLNITAMLMDTFNQLEAYRGIFRWIEIVTVVFFVVEYMLRIWTADLLYPDMSRARSIRKFLLSYDGIVDLLTIIPVFFLSGFVAFRMLRVVRIFRLFQVNAQYDSFNVIKSVLYEKRNQIISSVFIILILMLASSLGVYSAECKAQPDVFENAFSGIWWSVSTMLTVGYGDIYPITTLGRLMAILTAFLGVGVVAIPTGIISAGFVEYYTKTQNSDAQLFDIQHIGEVMITKEHELCGKTAGSAFADYNCRILMVLRDDMSILPTESMVLKEEDIIIVQSKQLVKDKKK